MTSPAPRKQSVLIPLHADNWALSLASGYLGCRAKSDHALDAQSLGSGFLVGFDLGSIPAWAMQHGDSGPRVVVQIEVDTIECNRAGDVVLIKSPQRVTRALTAKFQNASDLRNFQASYSPFPDVPTKLVKSVVGGFDVATDKSDLPSLPREPVDQAKCHALEYRGGWAAGLLEASRKGEHADTLKIHLADLGGTPALLASSLLRACDQSASALDLAIWSTTVQVISEKVSARGFDRMELLKEIAGRLAEGKADTSGARTWISTCSKVVQSIVDPPPLTDDGRIGQRAALASLLANDARAASKIGETLDAGPKVQLLTIVAACAFEGLSRIDARIKNDRQAFNAILDIAEGISTNDPFSAPEDSQVSVDEPQPETPQSVSVGPSRKLPPHSSELILKARALEAGLELVFDEEAGECFLQHGLADQSKIFVEDDPSSTADHPVVRFVLELAPTAAKTGKQAHQLLALAWATGCAVGTRESANGATPCAFASQPTATLDRDEFSFHIGRLIALQQSLAPKKRPAAKRKPAAKSEKKT